MRVSISGTHSTGKSTLFDGLKKDSFFNECEFVAGPTRFLQQQGYPINNHADNYDSTQLMCLVYDLQVFEDTKLKDIIVSDRCLLDTYVYTKYLFKKGKVSEPVFLSVEKVWLAKKDSYDVFFLPSKNEVPLVADGVRSEDEDFRNEIQSLFLEIIDINGLKIYALEGSVEERIESMKGIMKMIKR